MITRFANFDIVLVGDQDDGQTLVIEVLEDLHDLDRCAAVEISRGFVRQKDRRAVDQCAGDRHTLLLPAGHLRRKMLRAIAKTNHGQGGCGAFPALGLAHAPIERWQLGIFECSCACQQMKPLENKPYLLISNVGQRLLVEMGDIDSLQQVVPGGWTVKAAQQIHERRLPAAACAHDGDEFAKLDRNAHPAQGVHSRLA